jgi:hypothetical protein
VGAWGPALWINLRGTLILLPPWLPKPTCETFSLAHCFLTRSDFLLRTRLLEGQAIAICRKRTAAPVSFSMSERHIGALNSSFQRFQQTGKRKNTAARTVTRKANLQFLAMLSSKGGVTLRRSQCQNSNVQGCESREVKTYRCKSVNPNSARSREARTRGKLAGCLMSYARKRILRERQRRRSGSKSAEQRLSARTKLAPTRASSCQLGQAQNLGTL